MHCALQPTDMIIHLHVSASRLHGGNNLLVALIPRINCRLLANEKTDSDYNVNYNVCNM